MTTRKTIAVPPKTHDFVHQTLIGLPPWKQMEETPVQMFVSSCTTLRPQPRCNCGMFDLEWHA